MDMDSDTDDVLILSTMTMLVFSLLLKKKYRKPRSMWVNPYLLKRSYKGRFVMDFNDMMNHDQTFRENFHMKMSDLEYIYARVKHRLVPIRNTRRDIIPPKQKLIMVLEYLTSGSFQRHIASTYRVSKQRFGEIIDQVCCAICSELKDEIQSMSKEDWLKNANDFNGKWNFPNCLGAIDGKHIAIRCPRNSSSLFYNYKGFHSIVLMAISDATYKFIYFDVGGYGSEGDASYFGNSKAGKRVIDNKLDLPEDATIGGMKLPFTFIADGAFPFTERIMKPYFYRTRALTKEERIFNYRLSRARRVVENSFGILSQKWLCLRRTMFCGPDRAQKIVSACVLLHNFLLSHSRDSYCPRSLADHYDINGKLIEGTWRSSHLEIFHQLSLNNNQRRRRTVDKEELNRNRLRDYFNSEQGAVKWQNKSIFV